MEMRFLAVSGRSPFGDKSVDGVGDGGLMSGCQIPVNSTIKQARIFWGGGGAHPLKRFLHPPIVSKFTIIYTI